MDILYKGGALLAAQAEGAARLCVAVPLAVLCNALPSSSWWGAATKARRPTGASSSSPSSSSSRCPFSGLLGSAAACPGARMAQAAAAARATAGGSAAPAPAGGDGDHGDDDSGDAPATNSSCWWVEGRVTHVRRRPARHAFAYDVRLALIDLDRPPQWFARSSQRRDHLTADQARAAASTRGRVLLLTLPAAAGYVQNPISVYYCYDDDGDEGGDGGDGDGEDAERGARGRAEGESATAAAEKKQKQKQRQRRRPSAAARRASPPLRRCIAEVTNTPWGERVSFVFDPRGASVPKSLHVSPFMDMRNVWLLKATDPLAAIGGGGGGGEGGGGGGEGDNNRDGDNNNPGRVVLSVLVDHPELGRYFDAQFVGKVALSSLSGAADNDRRGERLGSLRALWRHGFLPQRVAVWIYAHAVLLALKGVRVQPKPLAGTYAARAEAALKKKDRGAGQEGGGGGAPPIPWAGGRAAFVWRPALRWPWYLD